MTFEIKVYVINYEMNRIEMILYHTDCLYDLIQIIDVATPSLERLFRLCLIFRFVLAIVIAVGLI